MGRTRPESPKCRASSRPHMRPKRGRELRCRLPTSASSVNNCSMSVDVGQTSTKFAAASAELFRIWVEVDIDRPTSFRNQSTLTRFRPALAIIRLTLGQRSTEISKDFDGHRRNVDKLKPNFDHFQGGGTMITQEHLLTNAAQFVQSYWGAAFWRKLRVVSNGRVHRRWVPPSQGGPSAAT